MSSAAWRLPPFGTLSPLVWQDRHKFSFWSPAIGFKSWFFRSLVCGSWHFRQSRTAGWCTVPLIWSGFFSAWQVKQSAGGVLVINLTRVTSLVTRTSWQLVHPVAMAEWTALPFALSP